MLDRKVSFICLKTGLPRNLKEICGKYSSPYPPYHEYGYPPEKASLQSLKSAVLHWFALNELAGSALCVKVGFSIILWFFSCGKGIWRWRRKKGQFLPFFLQKRGSLMFCCNSNLLFFNLLPIRPNAFFAFFKLFFRQVFYKK